jgi:hypothetical protein
VQLPAVSLGTFDATFLLTSYMFSTALPMELAVIIIIIIIIIIDKTPCFVICNRSSFVLSEQSEDRREMKAASFVSQTTGLVRLLS